MTSWRGDGDDGSNSGGGGARGGHQHVWPLLVELWLALLEPWKAGARLATLGAPHGERTTMRGTMRDFRATAARAHDVSLPEAQRRACASLQANARHDLEADVEVDDSDDADAVCAGLEAGARGARLGSLRATRWYDDCLL